MRNLFLLPFALIFSQHSFACFVKGNLTDEIKSKADAVFVGEAISYTPPARESNSRKWKPAVIKFKISKTISGAAQELVEVYWVNGTYGESRSLEDFKKKYGKITRFGIEHINKFELKDKPWILQGVCTDPYMSEEK